MRKRALTLALNTILFVAAGSNAMSVQAQENVPSNTTTPPVQAESDPVVHEKAEQELRIEERQRILGVLPNFNTTNEKDAAPLSSGQKFRLAVRGAVDPFQFFAAAADAGLGQARNEFPGYGQGAQGYGKRFAAAYTDQFSAAIWGNAVLPSLLHEDPRYFRKGEGTTEHRFLYAVASTFWTRNDNGTWGPNYSNVLGNIAAGGLSNLYYPKSDRGWGLTFERAATVTAESALGAIFVEFWPDISRKLFHTHANRLDGRR